LFPHRCPQTGDPDRCFESKTYIKA
jgi:hypothetical protein